MTNVSDLHGDYLQTDQLQHNGLYPIPQSTCTFHSQENGCRQVHIIHF